MKTESEVEVGEMVDLVRRRLDHRMEHGGDMFDGFGGLRSGYGANGLAISSDVTRRSIKRTPTFDVTHEQRWDDTCDQRQDIPEQPHRRTNLPWRTSGELMGKEGRKKIRLENQAAI